MSRSIVRSKINAKYNSGGTGGGSGNSSSGGAYINYYLNGSVSQGTLGGNTYYQMRRVPILGAGTDFNITADGYVAQFITNATDPNQLGIPAGNWTFNLYFSASSAGGSPSFYVELYKYDGTTFTLLASSVATPEGITNGTSIDLYTTNLAVPQTSLSLNDRLAVRIFVTHSGRTITLHTEDNHLCEIITTLSTGIAVYDESTLLSNAATSFNFTGSGVTATNVGDAITVNVPGGGSGTVTSVGLTAGTGISISGTNPITSSGSMTITNTDGASSVTLSSVGGGSSLVNDGTGPSLAIKSISAAGGASLTVNSTQLQINACAPLTILDEGTSLTVAPTSINFLGAGVTATNTGGLVEVTIPGGGSTTPGGVDTNIQFNAASSFGGRNGFTYQYDIGAADQDKFLHQYNIDFATVPYDINFKGSYVPNNIGSAHDQYAGITHWQYQLESGDPATTIYLFDPGLSLGTNLQIYGFKCDYSLLLYTSGGVGSRTGTLVGAWTNDPGNYPATLKDDYVDGELIYNELGKVVFSLSWNSTYHELQMDCTNVLSGKTLFNGVFTIFGSNLA